MLKLVSKSDTYERVYHMSGVSEEELPVFVIKKLSAGEVNSIQDQLTSTGGKGDTKMYFLAGTSARLKVRYALVDWRNVVGEDEQPINCTDENKVKIPANVQAWLEDIIDTDNGLKGISETERKNS